MKFYGNKELLAAALGLAGYGYGESENNGVHTFTLVGGAQIIWDSSTGNLTAAGPASEVARARGKLQELLSSKAHRKVADRFKRAVELN